MKKIQINLIMISLLAITTLYSCKKDVQDESRITNFPTFKMEGKATILHKLGTDFTDPGCVATEDGKALPVTVSVVGENTGYKGTTINKDVADKYVITYTATNSDGFPGSVTRSVCVGETGDFTTSIAGIYTSNVRRAPAFALTAQYTALKYIFIYKTGDNTYSISCAIGGYYSMGRKYGPAYNASGAIITANNIAANDFAVTGDIVVKGFGDVNVEVTDFQIDPTTKKITFTGTANISNGAFKVELTQVEF